MFRTVGYANILSLFERLHLWEQIHNPNFKPIEFDRFKAEAGDNAFTLTPQQQLKKDEADRLAIGYINTEKYSKSILRKHLHKYLKIHIIYL